MKCFDSIEAPGNDVLPQVLMLIYNKKRLMFKKQALFLVLSNKIFH